MPEPDEPIILSAVSAETVQIETVSVEDVTPVAEDDAPSTTTKAEQPVSDTPVESDAARIEAQLSELLSEDLNALREGRIPTRADAIPAAAEEPQSVREKATPSGASSQPVSDAPISDPFAFDLGPSPFAPKPETQRSTEPAEVTATPRVEPSSPSSDVQRPAGFTRPDHGEHAAYKNGSSTYPPASSTSTSAFGRPTSIQPQPANPQPEPAAAKPRGTFAVPSVSATLGPTRRLEPLSNAFRPAPPVEPFIPAAEVIPEPFATPETARTPELPSATASNAYDELPPLGGLPAISSESGLDRPMEDAVADLLRPLLKTWLAENMPKIVERALRREMSERLLPGQKNPRT